MLAADKLTLIQHLQCKHATWNQDFNKKLAIGQCTEEMHEVNTRLSYMIKVIYRYFSYEDILAIVSPSVPAHTDELNDEYNCITCTELNDIICKILELMDECNCN
jgi:hypothetical protein